MVISPFSVQISRSEIPAKYFISQDQDSYNTKKSLAIRLYDKGRSYTIAVPPFLSEHTVCSNHLFWW